MAAPGGILINLLLKADEARRDALDFAKSMGKVGAAADQTDTDLRGTQKAFDKTGDAADQAADDLRRSALRMAQGVDQGADKIDKSTDGIKRDLGETGKEAGAEFIGNIAEGIGSGQANVNDIVSGTLGGITNLAATMPGIGTAAGIAAAGIGLVFSAIKGESEKAAAKIEELRGALDGIADLASQEAQEAIFQTWITDAQKTTGKIENVNATLKEAGVSAEDFQEALAGNPAAIERVRQGLNRQGTEIIRSQKATGQLTDEQKRYQATMPKILQDIHAQDAAVGAVRREHAAINELTDGYNTDLTDAAAKARTLAAELDEATKDRDVKVRVALEKGATMGEALGGYWGNSASAMAMTARAAPPPLKVTVEGVPAPRNARELVALLESHSTRMGRRPGQPRSVAW